MKSYKLKLSLIFGFFVLLQGQACENIEGFTAYSSTDSNGKYVEGDEGLVELKSKKEYRIAGVNEIRPSIESILGVEFDNRSQFQFWEHLYSEKGYVDSIGVPMWLGLVNISGEACESLVASEAKLKAHERKFFKAFDFSQGPSMQSEAALEKGVRALARSAWMRNELPEELQIIKEEMAIFSGTSSLETEKLAVSLCTAMVASLDTHKR